MKNSDREILTKQIKDWNALRMDLFEISLPNESLEFSGVMKFFFLTTDNKLQTKCLRISSKDTTLDVTKSLVSKFFPLSENPNYDSFRIYESLKNKERKLKNDEFPLIVQLSSMNSAHEAKFLLKFDGKSKKSEKNIEFLKRRWSLRKEITKNDCVKANIPEYVLESSEMEKTNSNRQCTDEKLHKKLEKDFQNKFQQMVQDSGGPENTGAIKIYGNKLNPDIPYKTILISVNDSIQTIIKKSLEKYNLPNANPSEYCLVMRVKNQNDYREEVLSENICLIKFLMNSVRSNKSASINIDIRPKSSICQISQQMEISGRSEDHLPVPKRVSSLTPSDSISSSTNNNNLQDVKNFLIEIDVNGHEKPNRMPIFLPVNFGLVLIGNASKSPNPNLIMLSLPEKSYPGLAVYHCVLWQIPNTNSPSGASLMCSSYKSSSKNMVYINNQLLPNPSVQARLNHGDVIKLGQKNSCIFRVFITWNGSRASSARSQDSSSRIEQTTSPYQSQAISQMSCNNNIMPPPVPIHKPNKIHHERTQSSDLITSHASNTRPSSLSTYSPSSIGNQPDFSSKPKAFASCQVKENSNREPVRLEEPKVLLNKQLSSSSSAPSVSDKLPCQLAYAPAILNDFLDWLMNRKMVNNTCPLGPSVSVYLMLRAICRQCDRWEAIEAKENSTDNSIKVSSRKEFLLPELRLRNLQPLQWRRRRRQILSVLIGAIERLSDYHSNNLLSSSPHSGLSSYPGFLSNSSQLLHLITHDVDLSVTFQEPLDIGETSESFEDRQTAHQAWQLIMNKLANLTETYFEELSQAACSLIQANIAPMLMKRFIEIILKVELDSEGNENPRNIADFIEQEVITEDPFISFLNEFSTTSAECFLNSGIIVQLFVRMLHHLNCDLFNQLISGSLLIEEDLRESIDFDKKKLEGILQINTLTPLWGNILKVWLNKCIYPWFEAHGFLQAAECYLLRLSQLAEVLLTDINSVESLYNMVVDLIRLNSVQVRKILENYQTKTVELTGPPTSTTVGSSAKVKSSNYIGSQAGEYEYEIDENEDDSLNMTNSPNTTIIIPIQWIDFVVSGVKQVADKILVEEENQPEDDGEDSGMSHSNTTFEPQLLDRKELNLPFLLPDDSYPSEVSLSVSTKDLKMIEKILQEKSSLPECYQVKNSNEISIQSIIEFLKEPIANGWIRLSLRPINVDNDKLTWSAYLALSQPDSVNTKMVKDITLTNLTDIKDCNDNEIFKQQKNSDVKLEQASPDFRTHEVSVEKNGSSLGLTILAAKSDLGEDLGIFIKSIQPNGPCQKAIWISGDPLEPNEAPLIPGDRLLMVNGEPITGLTQEQASKLVAEAGNQINITITRDLGVYSISSQLVANMKREANVQDSLNEIEDAYDELKEPLCDTSQIKNNDLQVTRRYDSESPTETYGEFLTTAKLLRNMRDELAKCFDEKGSINDPKEQITHPKLSTYRNLSKMKGAISLDQRTHSSYSFSSLLQNRRDSTNNLEFSMPHDSVVSQTTINTSLAALKSSRLHPHRNSLPLSRVTKSLGDLSVRKSFIDDATNPTHEFPASASLFYPNMAQQKNDMTLIDDISKNVLESTSYLHDRLMIEQRERSKSADRNRLTSWIRLNEDTNKGRMIDAIS